MIKLKRPQVPTVNDIHGNNKMLFAKSDMCYEYDMIPDDFDDGIENFVFNSKLYGHANIKTALIDAQNGKCAFCEQNVINVSYGDIEHFRPKGGYSQNEKDDLNKPGYYWLAYDFENLFFVCQICNQREKKNYFPIRNPEKRALNHHSNLNLEKPFFVNPYKENPKFLIGFRKEYAYGKDRRNRGKKTIEIIGLNRSNPNNSDLLELRRDHLALVNLSYKISKKQPGGDLTQQEIDDAASLVETFKSKKQHLIQLLSY